MAGEWLKLEKSTADKPEIFAIAERLGIDPDAVLGKCIRVWSWFDSHTTNGTANGAGVTKALIDRLTGVSGFADSMLFVGWITQLDGESGGFALPNFDRHNGETAKQRALTAKRVAKHKNAEVNAKVTDEALPREEKRREEKNIKTKDSAPAALPVWLNEETWKAYCKHRGSKFTEHAKTLTIKQLTKFKAAGHEPNSIIETSIANGWKGVFEPKSKGFVQPAPVAKIPFAPPPEQIERANPDFVRKLLSGVGKAMP